MYSLLRKGFRWALVFLYRKFSYADLLAYRPVSNRQASVFSRT